MLCIICLGIIVGRLWTFLLFVTSGFVEHLSVTLGAQQSVTKIISLAVANFATPKAGARLLCNEGRLLCNEGASGVGLMNIQVILW
jgi:hypothetical protein